MSAQLPTDATRHYAVAMGKDANDAQTVVNHPSFRLRYNLKRNSFSDSENKVAEYFLRTPEAVYQSITEVVKNAGVGYGSVNRFCQRLGCSGFQELKILLAHDLALFSEETARERSETLDQYHRRITEVLLATRQLCSDQLLDDVARLLNKANQVVIGGIGGSAPAVLALEYRLNRIGVPCTAFTDGFMFAIRAAALSRRDVLFVVNFTGATKALIHGIEAAKKADVKVVAMTNFITAPITELADHCLFTAEDRDPLSVELHSALPSVFLVDVLFERVLKYRKNAADMVARTFAAVADQKM